MICNHCGIAFNQPVDTTHPVPHAKTQQDLEKTRSVLRAYVCPECKEPNIFHVRGNFIQHGNIFVPKEGYSEDLIYPSTPLAKKLPLEVPENIRKDYDEAVSIQHLSPRSTAALGRRLLEIILLDQGVPATKKTLYDQIEWAKSKGMPFYLTDSVDEIRKVGKFAAHAKEDIEQGIMLEVEPEEAMAVLLIIELLCDFYYVIPAKARERQEAITQKLKSTNKT